MTHNVPRWRELTREPMLELLLVVLASTLAGAGIDRIEVDPAVVGVDELGRVLRARGVELAGIELVSMAR